MKVSRDTALRLWEERYGYSGYAEDFDGALMCKAAYGDEHYFVWQGGEKIYCGWNIHHVLPVACGGTDCKDNLICTNIITNEEAADKTTFWIDDTLYQVRKNRRAGRYEIVCLFQNE